MLPSLENPAVWNDIFSQPFPQPDFQRERKQITLRYSEPFPTFFNAKIDGLLSKNNHAITAGFGGATIDSIYRELEFSGGYAYSPYDFLLFKLNETANLEWIPEYDSWWEHRITGGVNLFYKFTGNARAVAGGALAAKILKKESVQFSGDLTLGLNFPLYSLNLEMPLFESNNKNVYFLLSQKISLGYIDLCNSFSIPGFALGFAAVLNISKIAIAISHYRNANPNGHTGWVVRGW